MGQKGRWHPRFRVQSIVWAMLLVSAFQAAFGDAPVSGPAPEKPKPDNVAQDLKEIKKDLQTETKKTDDVPEGVLVGGNIKVRDEYRTYLMQAAEISADLLHVRDIMESQGRRLSLQQLGALTQRLSVAKAHFQALLMPGEEMFETYRLIDKAVTSLEEAIEYWRIANHYRPWERGNLSQLGEDEDILQLKLQAAVNAIESLSEAVKMRQTLSQDLDADR